MKRFFTIAWALVAAVAITACHNDTIDIPEIDSVPDGYMQISVPVAMPAMTEVATRGVDPDGMNIHKMSLFCFDKFGLFISYVDDVTLNATDATTGTVTKALVPDNTRRIHFVANQNMATFDDAAHRGMHEEQVMTELESSSGMMIYWGRYTDDNATSADDFKTTLNTTHGAGSPIMLLRNQAMVTVSVKDGVQFTPEGFTVVNTQAFGTVAPRHPELGFDFTIAGTNSDWVTTDFVTLPEDAAHQMKLTPPSDVDNAAATYVFETENTSDDPVSVIIKGSQNGESRYYRALVLVDEEYKMIRRNHHYKFEIVGPLSYGVETFDDAMETAPTNNVWLSIDDEVNEVRNGQYILGVEQTSVVVLAVPKDGGGYKYMYNGGELPNKQLSLNYTFSTIGGAYVAEKPEVKWLNNDVATDWLNHEYVSGRTDHFVEIQLKDILPDEEVQQTEGTILIQKGLLQRKIKVIVLKQQSFVPMWVTTQMYGGDTSTAEGFQGSNVTLLFTVPEHTPDELLPFEVMISVDHLDVRAASGQPLPVIRSDDPRYGSDIRKHPNATGTAEASEVIGYKYVYTVTQKGDQRVYFHNILDQTGNQHAGHSEYITVESPYFATLQKPFVFSTDNHQRVITISNLQTYSAAGSNDPVYYMLVPAKKGAHVKFDIRLMNGNTSITGKYKSDPTNNTDPFDEFLLYSEYLDHDDHAISSTECYAHFTDPIEAGKYGTNARTFGMHFTKAPITVDGNDNVYPIKMHTNRANSAEVVRLASNQTGSPSVWPMNGNEETYAGDGVDNFTYRSVIFELANYRPFRFMASVAGQGLADDDPSDGVDAVDHDAASGTVDGVSDVKWSYEPNQEIEVAFDITEFRFTAGAGSTAQDATVDPFGRAFKVYIDAPMLEIDETKASTLMNANVTLPDDTTVKKFYKDTDGRFVYVVDAIRATEAGYWSSTTTAHNTAANKKAGERKVLPFKTKSVVSTGEIRISADPDEVIYNEKVFNVSNRPITGTITYGVDAESQTNVPAGEFVSFALVSDNSRIGSLTVTADGRYELRLRPEYQFNWGTGSDPDNSPNKVTIDYTVTDGDTVTYYSATFNSLAALFGTLDSNGDSSQIKLVKQTQP